MKFKIIILLGLLVLMWNGCRHCVPKPPLLKEAYGYARLDTLRHLLTIKDEMEKDRAHAEKTYITKYADFGVSREKIDLNKKVYVYARKSTIELVSHMDMERMAGLLCGAEKLAMHNLLRSPATYFVPGMAVFFLLLYYIGCRTLLNVYKSGKSLFRATFVGFLLRSVMVLSIFMMMMVVLSLFLFIKSPLLVRETIPVQVEQMNAAVADAVISDDVLTGKPISSLPEKTTNLWENQVFHASGKMSNGELLFLRDTYNDLTAIFRWFIWMAGILFLFFGIRFISVWTKQMLKRSFGSVGGCTVLREI